MRCWIFTFTSIEVQNSRELFLIIQMYPCIPYTVYVIIFNNWQPNYDLKIPDSTSYDLENQWKIFLKETYRDEYLALTRLWSWMRLVIGQWASWFQMTWLSFGIILKIRKWMPRNSTYDTLLTSIKRVINMSHSISWVIRAFIEIVTSSLINYGFR